MPQYRFIVEGCDFELPTRVEDGEQSFVNGFFAARKARAPDLSTAQSLVLKRLEEEWSEHEPTLTVMDGWKVCLFDFRRASKAGHVFFSDEDSRYAAASVEAEAACAPKSAAIWKLANMYVADEDD
jgi:hypothetical protein